MRPARLNIIRALAPEADLLVDYMTVRPQGNRAFLVSDTVRRLKAASLWTRLDAAWFTAAHDAQAGRLNWKSPSTFALSEVSSPTFTADRGYAGNGSTSYLNTGWDMVNNGANFVLNDFSMGAYVNATGSDAASTAVNLGSFDSVSGATLNVRRTGDGIGTRSNSLTSDSIGTGATTRLGLSVRQRTGSTAGEAFKNGASLGTSATSSLATNSVDFFIGGINTSGTFGSGVTDRHAMAFLGGSLSAQQHIALDQIVRYYLVALGAT
tara:strand:+ start:373 stop:1170 length:798 start_codon:yes stop_codon:yes gene_type:complete